MERIVITWWTTGEVVRCVNFESCESLYIQLEAKVKEYIDARQKYNESNKKWREQSRGIVKLYKKMAVKKGKEEADAHFAKEFEEHNQLRPTAPNNVLILSGLEFDLSNFQEFDAIADKTVPNLPEIQTLEEWWNSKVEN